MPKNNSLFHSYCESPDCALSIQDKNETILLVLRAHPVTLVPKVVVIIIATIFPLILSPLFSLASLSATQLLFIIFFYYALVVSYTLTVLFFWYFNLGIITSQRIVDIDVINLLNTQVTATLIGRVEEVDNKTLGLLSAWFDYGNVFVQTAGNDPNVEFERVPRPTHVVALINNLMKNNGT